MRNVTRTDEWMISVRAKEAARPDAIITDPAAISLAHIGNVTNVALQYSHSAVILRRRFGDDVIAESTSRGVRQAVSLGAGSDTRAYTSALPGEFKYFEIDFPGQTAIKRSLLATAGINPYCKLITVEQDLRKPAWIQALLNSGFRCDLPTVWLAEGLFYFFTRSELCLLMRQITALSSHGSRLSFDIGDADFCTAPQTALLRQLVARRGVRYREGMGDPKGWLAPFGWHTHAYHADDICADRCSWLHATPKRLKKELDCTWFVRACRPSSPVECCECP
ncbi:class I SAM-dependent methyltransferase [Streptomyces roseus]|uniref:class I SAM-dependent methyltransferase n=1 Tax=Streptomyces roseus TaxID=66430 RepID=UPI00380EC3BE